MAPLQPPADAGASPFIDPTVAPDAEGADVGQTITPRYLFGLVIRHRWMVAGIILASMALGLIASLLITPRYTAAASVQIDQETRRVLESEEAQPAAAYQDADRFLKTQVDVLRSRRMAERVATELRLFDGDAFLRTMRAPVPEPTDGRLAERRREAVVRALEQGLGVYLPTESRVVSISFTSPDSTQAAKIANAYATSYIRYNLERRFDSTAYAREFLERQLGDAKTKLEASERQANSYVRSIGLIRTTAPGDRTGTQPQQSVTTASLIQLNEQLNDATAGRIAAEARWSRIAGQPLNAISEVVNNQAVQRLIEERATVESALRAELAKRQEAYPTVAPLRAQLNEIDRQVTSLSRGIRQTIESDFRVAAQRERELNARVAALKGETLREQDRSVQLNLLTREVDQNRQQYDALLQRYKELQAESGITTSNVLLVDQAVAPFRPASPRLLLNIALATLIGLLLAAAAIFLRETLDDRMRTPDDVERKLGLRPLGVTPLIATDKTPLDALRDPKSSLSESYFAIRTALQFSSSAGAPRRLLVTSAQPAEGKSTTALALARSFAELGRRVVLVDGDLRRPSVHRTLSLANETGFSSLLTRQATIDAALQRDPDDLYNVITSGPIPPSPTELLSSETLVETLDALDARFDVIVIDGPPVLGLADSPILAVQARSLFVVRAGKAHRGAAKQSLRRLQQTGARVLGAVFTQFDFDTARKLGYGYGYGYGYGEGGYSYYTYESRG